MKKLTKKEKVLLGVTIVSAGAAGYFGYKYISLKKSNEQRYDRLNFLEFLVIESGCIPKAKQNGENKLAREESKMKALLESISKNPNDKQLKVAYDKHKNEHAAIGYQLGNLYKLEDMMNKEENIYAK